MHAYGALARAVQDNFVETIGPQILSELTLFINQFQLCDKLQAVEGARRQKRETGTEKCVQNAPKKPRGSQEQGSSQTSGAINNQRPLYKSKHTTSIPNTYAEAAKKPQEGSLSPPPNTARPGRLVLQLAKVPVSLKDKEKRPKPIKIVLWDTVPQVQELVHQI